MCVRALSITTMRAFIYDYGNEFGLAVLSTMSGPTAVSVSHATLRNQHRRLTRMLRVLFNNVFVHNQLSAHNYTIKYLLAALFECPFSFVYMYSSSS